jgi:hypothetical protein
VFVCLCVFVCVGGAGYNCCVAIATVLTSHISMLYISIVVNDSDDGEFVLSHLHHIHNNYQVAHQKRSRKV